MDCCNAHATSELGHVWTAPWQELYVPAGSAFRPDHNEPCGSLSVPQHEIQRGRMHFHVAVVLCGDHQTRERTVLSGVPVTAGPARPWQRDCRAWPVAPEPVSPPGATLTTAAKLLAKDDRRHRIGWRGAGGRRRCACQQHGRGQVLVSFCVFMRALHFCNDRPPRNTALDCAVSAKSRSRANRQFSSPPRFPTGGCKQSAPDAYHRRWAACAPLNRWSFNAACWR